MSRTIKQLPGPPALPLLGNALQMATDQLHLKFLEWSKKYGPIFTFRLWRQPVVVLSEPNSIMHILRNRPKDFRRFHSMEKAFREIGAHGLFSAEGADWKKQRSLVARGLGVNQIKTFYPQLLEMIERLETRLRVAGANGQPVDIQKEFMRFTIDVSCNIAFGYDPKSLINDDDQLQKNLEIMFPMISRRLRSPFPYWRYFKLAKDRELDRALAEVRRIILALIESCREKVRNQTGAAPASMLEAMIMAGDAEHGGFTDEELFGNVITLMLAGEDTTANTLAWMVHYLSSNLSLQTTLREEAEALLPTPASHPRFDQLENLQWIDAVAQESMRLKPVAPFLFLENLENFDLDGTEIPRGTLMVMLLLAPYLDEKYFSHPREFRPERWIAGKSAAYVHNPTVFMPFGYGPRFCPGSTLAMAEIKAAMATLIRRFTFEPVENTQPRDVFQFTTTPKGLWVRVHPHEQSASRAQARATA